jgi:hypothetical protein
MENREEWGCLVILSDQKTGKQNGNGQAAGRHKPQYS